MYVDRERYIETKRHRQRERKRARERACATSVNLPYLVRVTEY